jgi:serine protease
MEFSKRTTRHYPSLIAACLGLFAVLFASPVTAEISNDWEECLAEAEPTTRNVAPNPPKRYWDVSFTNRANYFVDTDADADEIVIDFGDHISDEAIDRFGTKRGLDLELNSPYSAEENLYIAKVAEGAVPKLETCLAKTDIDIEAMDENVHFTALGQTPNDPMYQFQWNFKQVDAKGAWDTSTGDDTTVAVIDTGVAFDEAPEDGILRPKDLEETGRTQGYDFVDNDDFAWDGHGHGTHVAGTIAQTTNNKYGVAGVAYDADIMPLRVLNSSGFGDLSDIADAIRYAADNGADVINMSLGGPIPSFVLSRAIKYAHKQGVTIIAAAGNSGKNAPSYPAAHKHVVAVAATQYDETTTFYSQWGDFVDIAAPGGNTRVDQNDDGRPDGVMQETLKDGETDEHDMVLFMGTSMASPHAAAVAALIESKGITHPERVEEILKDSADDSMKKSSSSEFDERYGAGIIQADEAAQAAVQGVGSMRFGAGFLIALLGLIGLRRRRTVGGESEKSTSEIAGISILSGLFAGGLFFVPSLPFADMLAFSATPIAEFDLLLFGPSAHQNPLLASFAVPLLGYALLGGQRWGRILAGALGFGLAGFCVTEMYSLTSDVQWIPGMNLLDRGWMAINALLSAWIGYTGLK